MKLWSPLFFIAACVVLCPALMTWTQVITHMVDNTPLSSAGTAVMPPVSLLTTSYSPRWVGSGQEVGREQSGQLTPTDQRDIPHHLILCSAVITGGKMEKGKDIHGYSTCLPKQSLDLLRPSFPESRWRSACWWRVVNQFFILLHFHARFLLSLLVSLSQPTIPFAFLHSFFSFPSPGIGEWPKGRMGA